MKTGYAKAALVIVSAALLTSMFFAVAVSKDKGGHSQAGNRAADVDVHVGVGIFVDRDREIIRRYFRDHSGSLPPGLAKRGGNLPPGLAKQLQRNGSLPPGLEKKVTAFPVDLEERLSPLKPGLVRGFIEGRALLFNKKTSVILDIFAAF